MPSGWWNKYYLFVIVTIAIFLSGCTTSRYTWNNYDSVLYQHYKNPHENDAFIEKIKDIIQQGEASDTIPPGIYAEYGYALYEKGQYPEAMDLFQKEYDKWPESRVFMTKMISNTEKQYNTNKQKDALESATKKWG